MCFLGVPVDGVWAVSWGDVECLLAGRHREKSENSSK